MDKTHTLTAKPLLLLLALISLPVIFSLPANAGAATQKEPAQYLRHAAQSSATKASSAVAIASALVDPCPYTELTPSAENIQEVREATLCLINQERARHKELPLKVNAHLQQAAQSHSEQMLSENYFAHTSPSGETVTQRILASGYIPNPRDLYMLGENIAAGTLSLATPQAMVEAWIASPEHLDNILCGEFSSTGIGVEAAAPAFISGGQPGAIYSQTFGVLAK